MSAVDLLISPILGLTKANSASVQCKDGSYITQLDGTMNKWLYSVKGTCSNGSVLPSYGKPGVTPWKITSNTGFSGWNTARSGDATNQIVFIDSTGKILPTIGSIGGSEIPKWTCPKGSLINGMNLTYDNYGITTQFLCSKPITTTQPYASVLNTTPVSTTVNTASAPTTVNSTPVSTSVPTTVNSTPVSTTVNTAPVTVAVDSTSSALSKTNTEIQDTNSNSVTYTTNLEKNPKPNTISPWLVFIVLLLVITIVGVVYAIHKSTQKASNT